MAKLKKPTRIETKDWICNKELSGKGEEMLFCTHKKKDGLASLFPDSVRVSGKTSEEIKI